MAKYELLRDPRLRPVVLSRQDRALNVLSEVIEELETTVTRGPLLDQLSRIVVKLKRVASWLTEEP